MEFVLILKILCLQFPLMIIAATTETYIFVATLKNQFFQ